LKKFGKSCQNATFSHSLTGAIARCASFWPFFPLFENIPAFAPKCAIFTLAYRIDARCASFWYALFPAVRKYPGNHAKMRHFMCRKKGSGGWMRFFHCEFK